MGGGAGDVAAAAAESRIMPNAVTTRKREKGWFSSWYLVFSYQVWRPWLSECWWARERRSIRGIPSEHLAHGHGCSSPRACSRWIELKKGRELGVPAQKNRNHAINISGRMRSSRGCGAASECGRRPGQRPLRVLSQFSKRRRAAWKSGGVCS